MNCVCLIVLQCFRNESETCVCWQDAVVLQPLASAALWGPCPGCRGRVQVQSGYLLPLSTWFRPAGVYTVRQWQVTQSWQCIYSLSVIYSLYRYISISSLSQHTELSASCIPWCLCRGPRSSGRTSRCSDWHRWGRAPLHLVRKMNREVFRSLSCQWLPHSNRSLKYLMTSSFVPTESLMHC